MVLTCLISCDLHDLEPGDSKHAEPHGAALAGLRNGAALILGKFRRETAVFNCTCSEFGAVSAHLETLVRQREDDTTGQPRACTADDYASIQVRLCRYSDSKGAFGN